MTLVTEGRPYDHHPLVTASLRTLSVLEQACGEAFLAASDRVEGLEERFQAAVDRGRLAVRGHEARQRVEMTAAIAQDLADVTRSEIRRRWRAMQLRRASSDDDTPSST